VDVAPLLLYSLGVPIPEDMDGRLPTGAFEPAELVLRPPQSAAGCPPAGADGEPEPVTSEIVYDAEEEAMMLGQLRALGYLE
jgi:hypothetical protein